MSIKLEKGKQNKTKPYCQRKSSMKYFKKLSQTWGESFHIARDHCNKVDEKIPTSRQVIVKFQNNGDKEKRFKRKILLQTKKIEIKMFPSFSIATFFKAVEQYFQNSKGKRFSIKNSLSSQTIKCRDRMKSFPDLQVSKNLPLMHLVSGSYWGMCPTKIWGQTRKKKARGHWPRREVTGISQWWLCMGSWGSFTDGSRGFPGRLNW